MTFKELATHLEALAKQVRECPGNLEKSEFGTEWEKGGYEIINGFIDVVGPANNELYFQCNVYMTLYGARSNSQVHFRSKIP